MSISKEQSILEAKLFTLLLGHEITSEITRKDESYLRSFHTSHKHVSHKFFRFMRECLFHYVKSYGIGEASQKLGISDYIIETILENMKSIHKSQHSVKGLESEILGNKVDKNTDEPYIHMYGNKITYLPEFKFRVVEAYLSEPKTSVIAKRFEIPRIKVKDWVTHYLQGRPFRNIKRGHYSGDRAKEID